MNKMKTIQKQNNVQQFNILGIKIKNKRKQNYSKINKIERVRN